MLDSLASASWKRPWALLGASLGLLAALAGIVALTSGGLGTGSDRIEGESATTVVVTVEGRGEVEPRVADVALQAILANVEADPAVRAVRLARGAPAGSDTVLVATLASDDGGEARAAVERLRAQIDPGPLQVSVGGETGELLDAGSKLLDGLWPLALPAAALALIALGLLLGWRLLAAPVICAAAGVTGALAGLGLGGAVADPALLAAPAGAAVGLVGGIELAAILIARCEDQARFTVPDEVLGNALVRATTPLAFVAGVAALGSAGMLAAGYGPAGSLALASGAAVACAGAAALLTVPPLYALELQARARMGAGTAPADSRAVEALTALPDWLAPRRRGTGLVAGSALALLAALLVGASGAETVSLSGAVDAATDALASDLPLVLALGGALVAAGLYVRGRDPTDPLCALLVPLPAAGAVALTALAFPAAISIASVATFVATLLAVSGLRSAAALDAVVLERTHDPAPAGIAERAARLTMPAALAGTVAGGLGAGVLLGAELTAARELGLGLAAGLVADLVGVRPVTLALLARWGARGDGDEQQ